MPSKYKTPDGMVSERTLRSLIRSLADRLKKEKLTAKQIIFLLREQERLSEQLRQTAIARERARNDAVKGQPAGNPVER